MAHVHWPILVHVVERKNSGRAKNPCPVKKQEYQFWQTQNNATLHYNDYSATVAE
jgi:hypothetical protein